MSLWDELVSGAERLGSEIRSGLTQAGYYLLGAFQTGPGFILSSLSPGLTMAAPLTGPGPLLGTTRAVETYGSEYWSSLVNMYRQQNWVLSNLGIPTWPAPVRAAATVLSQNFPVPGTEGATQAVSSVIAAPRKALGAVLAGLAGLAVLPAVVQVFGAQPQPSGASGPGSLYDVIDLVSSLLPLMMLMFMMTMMMTMFRELSSVAGSQGPRSQSQS